MGLVHLTTKIAGMALVSAAALFLSAGSGFVLFALGTALMLGSWYGVLGGFCLIGLMARRAVLEERMLRKELAGYDHYMRRLPYRLFPRVW